ncbi:MAG: PilT/PilU family type 4a pilus ATPase [Patescibacteria group bacterium]
MQNQYQAQLESLLATVLAESASDLHLSEGRNPVIRIAGQLLPMVKAESLTPEMISGFASVFMTPERKQLFLANHEVDFAYDFQGKARFRVNGFFQQGKMGFALRLIPNQIRSIEELGLPPILNTFTEKPQGFFLVVGPVGQGKSTTLAGMIEYINRQRAAHILTIEDPIEYIYEAKRSIINQREVGVDTKTFAGALAAMFREDINVALVGEMRDADTISTAVTAAETGHLVLSTLHTNNAAQTINRIIDSFPASQQDQIRSQLAASLTGIFSQRLIPRVSGGLVPAYELLINNTAVGNLIREKRVHEINTVLETSSEQGMISMDRSLAELVRAGEITVENAYLHSTNTKILERLL